jgi:hypothetical protein
MRKIHTPAELIEQVLQREPNLGEGDASKCLPGWINTFCKKFEERQGYTLSHEGVNALCHTLIAARFRAERLVRERDALAAELEQLRAAVDSTVRDPA